MGYGIRDGDIISLGQEKAGALTLSQPLPDFRPRGGMDPYDLWASQPAVRTVIGFIARSVSSVPFNVYHGDDHGGKTLQPEHVVHRALHQPWPKQGQGRFVEALINDLYIFGRWGFLVMPNGEDSYEFPKLKGNRFSAVVDGFGRYNGIAIWPEKGSSPEIIPTDDVVFDLGPEPLFGEHRAGSTSVATLEDLAKELDALGEYRSELFQNSARVPAVIERPQGAGKWSDEAWMRFKESFATYKAGGGNAGGTPVLEDGMTYRAIDTVSPKDAQYIDVRRLALEEAAEALHVPPELVGARQGTYSNIAALREQMYEDVLGPLIKWTQEALNVGLAPLLGAGEEIRADVDSKLRSDLATRIKVYQTAVGRPIWTANEARAMEGMPPIDGGDELVTPLNVSEGGLASPTDTGQTNEPDPMDPLPAPTAGEELPESSLGKAGAPQGAKADTGDDEAAAPYTSLDSEGLQKALDAMADDLGTAMLGVIDGVAERLGVEIVDTEPEKGRKRLPRAGRRRYDAGRVMEGGLNMSEALAAAFRAEDEKAVLAVLQNHLGVVAEQASLQTLGDLGADLGVWAKEKQYGWLSEAGKTYAQFLVDTGFYEKFEDIRDLGVQELPQRLTMMLNVALAHAERGINTIGTDVVGFGAADAAKAAKATHKTWHTTSAHPRPTHAAQNGVTIPVQDVFPDQLRWPGDYFGKGPETANCQCRLTYS